MTRRGLSLLELLVVMAIVVVLIGLLLPAVQKVRAAAARVSCGNNLRQLGLGLHQYQAVHGAFPPATRDDNAAPYPFLSWMGRLLPYVDQGPLWDVTEAAFKSDPYQMRVPPHPGAMTPVPLFHCPAGATPSLVTMYDGQQAALGSYRAVNGTDLLASDGMIYRNSAVKNADVKDGLSQTLAAGESQPFHGDGITVGLWYNGQGVSNSTLLYGSPEVALGVRERNLVHGWGGNFGECAAGPHAYRPGTQADRCDMFHYWSFHPGGANFLAGDGSVRFLGYAADTVLPALATRFGGEVEGWGN
jgi:prepilin-type N-terminal cleavage/methylation domain-containing protein/prepilin-type processing-associated H-X9-DG protein